MKRPTDKGLDPQYHIAEYSDFVSDTKKYLDYLEEENAEHETTNRLLVTANDNLIAENLRLKKVEKEANELLYRL